MSINTLSVIGLGYIGLPTAALFADHQCAVIGVDVHQHVVDIINQGHIHIIEPGLGDMVRRVVKSGKLRAVVNPEPADAFLIAVPTPFKGEAHEPDLTYIESAAKALAPVLKKGDIVILESTSPVGTTESLAGWLRQARPDLRVARPDSDDCDLFVAYCPERVLPGRVLHELVANSRIIGGINAVSAERAEKVYSVFVKGALFKTNARTAEMAKLTENAFRDVNIAFANELSLICDRLHINVWELIKLANQHPRVNILNPGPGVGGHCIAVDPWFIVSKTPDLARMIRTARLVNDNKPDWVINKVLAARDDLLARCPEKAEADIRVAVLGLTFKPDIDDLRESPARGIVARLAAETQLSLRLVEPNIASLPPSLAGHRLWPLQDALEDADIILLLVAHKEFQGVSGGGGVSGAFGVGQVLIDCVGLTE